MTLNKNITNIIKQYLLPCRNLIRKNKSNCLKQLISRTRTIYNDMNDNVIFGYCTNGFYQITCKDYTKAKYHYNIRYGWDIFLPR